MKSDEAAAMYRRIYDDAYDLPAAVASRNVTRAIPRTGLKIKIRRGLPVRKEKDFQAEVVKIARLFGYLCHHQYDARKSEPGVPDLLIVGHGRCIHAELKRKGGRYTPAQRMWLAALLGAPCETYTWTDGVDDIRSIADILSRVT